MKKFLSSGGILLLVLSLLQSCMEEPMPQPNQKADNGRRGENTDILVQDISTIAGLVIDIADLDVMLLREALVAAKSNYYQDEQVFLTDLLTESQVYQYKPFTDAADGYLRSLRSEINQRATAANLDVTTVDENITLYFPYSDDHDLTNFNEITVVAATTDGDEAEGVRISSTGHETVLVNDDYAESNLTVIVGVNNLKSHALKYYHDVAPLLPEGYAVPPSDPEPPSLPDDFPDFPTPNPGITTEPFLQVYNSRATLRRQMDNFISLTGNGGGSEVMIGRITGYLEQVDGHVTSIRGGVTAVDFKRRDIRKKKNKDIFSIWYYSWPADDFEEVYAVWEDDTKGTKTFSGSINTTLSHGALEVAGSIGFDVNVRTQDDLLKQALLARSAYLVIGQPTSVNDCLGDQRFLTNLFEFWPGYNCGARWSNTLPYRYF